MKLVHKRGGARARGRMDWNAVVEYMEWSTCSECPVHPMLRKCSECGGGKGSAQSKTETSRIRQGTKEKMKKKRAEAKYAKASEGAKRARAGR